MLLSSGNILPHPFLPHCYDMSLQLKCHKYWPDETQDYGDISVMLVKQEHYSDYIIRTFNLKRVSCWRPLDSEIYKYKIFTIISGTK